MLLSFRPCGGPRPAADSVRAAPGVRGLVIAVLLLTAGLLLPAPSARAEGPTDRQVQQAEQRAMELARTQGDQAASVGRESRRLAELSVSANGALDALNRARVRARTAAAAAVQAEQRLTEARDNSAAARRLLGDFAAQAYRSGGTTARLGAAMSLVRDGDPQQLLSGLAALGHIGEEESRAVERVASAQTVLSAVSVDAERALASARAAEAAQAREKMTAESLVRAQADVLAGRRVALAQSQDQASVARRQAETLSQALAEAQSVERARQAAAVKAPADERRSASIVAEPPAPLATPPPTPLSTTPAAGPSQLPTRGAPEAPRCRGGNLDGYENGQLPRGALCPVWGAPDSQLRADASAAFTQLSKAFAVAFGVGICVTDAYRTYAEQVQLYRTQPAYSARPGTSEHGWGRATDLCGGIAQAGSPQSSWLQTHAAQYGWFHPGWAQIGGTGPFEPWHWEFAA